MTVRRAILRRLIPNKPFRTRCFQFVKKDVACFLITMVRPLGQLQAMLRNSIIETFSSCGLLQESSVRFCINDVIKALVDVRYLSTWDLLSRY